MATNRNKIFIGSGFIHLGDDPHIYVDINGKILEIVVLNIELDADDVGTKAMVDVYSLSKSVLFKKSREDFIDFMDGLFPIARFNNRSKVCKLGVDLKKGTVLKCYTVFGRSFLYKSRDVRQNMRRVIEERISMARKYYAALMRKIRKITARDPNVDPLTFIDYKMNQPYITKKAPD